ncbi:hypothetical protein C8J57DRAFT_1222869 [Mycena rebaudengoi]|nr:hypothetical protein C8J57DRAFT_1222869 [Mycena rebaudengoi]
MDTSRGPHPPGPFLHSAGYTAPRDVPAFPWPESRGCGLALTGFGPGKLQARRKPKATAWARKPKAAAFWQVAMLNFGFGLAKSQAKPKPTQSQNFGLALALVPKQKIVAFWPEANSGTSLAPAPRLTVAPPSPWYNCAETGDIQPPKLTKQSSFPGDNATYRFKDD